MTVGTERSATLEEIRITFNVIDPFDGQEGSFIRLRAQPLILCVNALNALHEFMATIGAAELLENEERRPIGSLRRLEKRSRRSHS